jgi:hypothetical protein
VSGSIATPAGTFSQASPAGADLNPYVDPTPWGKVIIDTQTIPGIVTTVNGARRPEEWSVQRGIAVAGAVTVWRGTKIAEAIKIVTILFDRADVQQHYVVKRLLSPKIGKKPPARNVINPHINFAGIIRIARVDVGGPEWIAKEGAWSAEYILIQFAPPRPVPAGTVEPPKPTAEDPANVAAAAELSGLLDRVARKAPKSYSGKDK